MRSRPDAGRIGAQGVISSFLKEVFYRAQVFKRVMVKFFYYPFWDVFHFFHRDSE
jgi:hypothetical protein